MNFNNLKQVKCIVALELWKTKLNLRKYLKQIDLHGKLEHSYCCGGFFKICFDKIGEEPVTDSNDFTRNRFLQGTYAS